MLLSGQAVGIVWPLFPKVAFGRLLIHPVVATVEVLLAAALLLLDWLDYRQKKWIISVASIAAVSCGFYHLFFYYIGMEFILIYGAVSLIRKYSRNA